jgi:hypothetical protein
MFRATNNSKRIPLEFITDTALPRYVERDHRNGNLSFCVYRGARTPLPSNATSAEFHTEYWRALVDSIAMESDDE